MHSNVVRCICVILAAITSLLPRIPHTPTDKALPSVSISLPPSVPSQTVQISYFLIGPFGGDGDYASQRSDVHSYEIPTAVDGKAATEVRMIIYASGCEIQTFVLHLTEGLAAKQGFPCHRVPTVTLSGRITPSELVAGRNVEVVVTYMAFWAHKFYGIADGMVTQFRVATVSPNLNGMFQVDVPYFSADAAASSKELRASFRLMLRDSQTENPVVWNLEPEMPELRAEDHSLQIRSHYPEGLKFTDERF
jgi:hypothetical protein